MNIIRLREFVFKLVNTFLSIFKMLFFTSGDNKFPIKGKQGELVILGNGPSLKELLDTQIDYLKSKDLLCVNYFARTEEYTLLKPEIYVICSPEYFTQEDKQDFAVERQLTLDTIAEKTSWPMTFCIPAIAKKNDFWKTKFKDHPFIRIFHMTTTPIEGFKGFEHWAFRKMLGMPRPHNVLIPSIYLAISLDYKEIEIAGADHSWLQEIYVDSDNEVLLSQKHFYDKQASKQKHYRDATIAQPMYHGGSKDSRKLHEVLEKFYYTFRAYWTLRSFAESKGKVLTNITPNSYIDAFQRKDIKIRKA